MKNIRKVISVILILALGLLIISGCNKKPAKNTSSAGSKTSSKATTKTTTANKSGTVAKTRVKGSTSATGEEVADNNEDEDSDNEQDVTEEDKNEDTPGIVEESIDLGGAEIVIWDPHYPNLPGKELALGQGGIINDALYYSMRDAEAKYNCKIRSISKTGTGPDLEFINAVLAGLVPCTLMKPSTAILPDYAMRNIVLPLDEYIDYNNPVLTEMGTDMDGQDLWKGEHYGYPHIDIKFGNNFLYLVVYDRESLEKQGIEDFRELEAQGRWNWSEMLSIAQQLTVDLNGDGIIDQYAMSGNYSYGANMLIASNGARVVYEENGIYKMGLDDPKFLRAMNFLNELMYVYKLWDTASMYQWNGCNASMAAGRSVFSLTNAMFVFNIPATTYKGRPVGFVVPPKGPDSDMTINEGSGGRYVVPATLKNLPDHANIIKAAIDAVTAWDTGKSLWSEKLNRPEGMKASNYIASNNGGYPIPQKDLDYWDKNSKNYTGVIYTGFTDYMNVINPQIVKIALGQVPPATGIEQIKAQAQAVLDKYNQ